MIEMTPRPFDEEDIHIMLAAGALGDRLPALHLVDRLRRAQANQQSDAERDAVGNALEIDPCEFSRLT